MTAAQRKGGRDSVGPRDLIPQHAETLAGRIAFVGVMPFSLVEGGAENLDRLWVRGGFPFLFWRSRTMRVGAGARPTSKRPPEDVLAFSQRLVERLEKSEDPEA